ncbi:spore germination protein [Bacillus sp. DJP31]|uniref:spore germination protein n=1 Tax=Bacillus sp. DJP31 TaxID=3409789 RepID=UPI003BB6AAA9
MPSIVGTIKIDSVGDGAFTVGDVFRISPNGSAQDKGGAGSFNTGDFMVLLDKKSSINVNDADFNDQYSLSIRPFLNK